MKIQKIQLKHFRNYSNLEISLGKGINIFYCYNSQFVIFINFKKTVEIFGES